MTQEERTSFGDWFLYMFLSSVAGNLSLFVQILYLCVIKKPNMRNYIIANLIIKGVVFILAMVFVCIAGIVGGILYG